HQRHQPAGPVLTPRGERAPGQPPPRGHAPRHPDAQAGQPRPGLRGHQRHAAARPGPARQPPGRRLRPARGRLPDPGGADPPPPPPPPAPRVERPRPNQLWQTDLPSTGPTADESMSRLHRAIWSMGPVAALDPHRLAWDVSGSNGENALEARGRSLAEAYWRA